MGWLIFGKNLGPQVLLIGILALEIPVLGYQLLARPFERLTDNLVETINEVYLTVISGCLAYFLREEQWDKTLTMVIAVVLISNVFIFSIITSGMIVVNNI